uniref:cytochrome-c oxidase n=1 Tax=Paragonimus heterotremus TaxID=100268 RepID=A0A386RWT6_9TREM|nr:cytochrome c oxidase subunit II [Paragonimus heterotremus]ATD85504.1 cytochrome c oxidase subunit II [Paragonimus heterotremus]AYE67513.1 cytochrome c oxidase subunit II [Paragonimus heterotremus]
MYVYTPLYSEMVGYISFLSAFIPIWVFLVLGWQLCSSYGTAALRNESDLLEFFWTVVPSVCVGFLCFLNLGCLGNDLILKTRGLVKVIGRQWYWSYDLNDGQGLYDSVMSDFIDGVDKPLRVYADTPYNLSITSSDVIHSFALPVVNLKVDAIPGRLNNTFFCMNHVGIFVGYCSELCGAGHAYMPIVVEAVEKAFIKD